MWLIAGGGIGGLAAAVALQRAGQRVRVFERAEAVRASGLGITLSPNAMVALDALGLASTVLDLGVRLSGGELRSADGRVLAPLWMDAMEARHGLPSVGIERGRLLDALLAAAGAASVRTGAECVGFREEVGGVCALLAGGEAVWGRALVGADGAGSAVRQQITGPATARYAGYTCWRGLAEIGPDAVGERGFFEMWGEGLRFGGIPVSERRFLWYAVANAPRGGRDDDGEVLTMLRRRFRDFAAPVRELLGHTAPGGVIRTDIEDRPPLWRWGSGPVTLLGDAAHPMTPNMGQGASQALEDAVVLGRCVARLPDAAGALRAYERARRQRAAGFVAMSRWAGRAGQLAHPWACAARDAALRAFPKPVMRAIAVRASRMSRGGRP